MLNPTKTAAMYDGYKAFLANRDILLSDSPQDITDLVHDHLSHGFLATLSRGPMRPLDICVGGGVSDPDYCARLIEGSLKNGMKALFYFVLDHRSRPDPDTNRHLHDCLSRAWKWYTRTYSHQVAMIVPLLVFTGCRARDLPNVVRGTTSLDGLAAGKADITVH